MNKITRYKTEWDLLDGLVSSFQQRTNYNYHWFMDSFSGIAYWQFSGKREITLEGMVAVYDDQRRKSKNRMVYTERLILWNAQLSWSIAMEKFRHKHNMPGSYLATDYSYDLQQSLLLNEYYVLLGIVVEGLSLRDVCQAIQLNPEQVSGILAEAFGKFRSKILGE